MGRGEPQNLAALIAAYHESDEPAGTLRATLPLAGRTLLERQVRLASAAGANPIVIAVERLPSELTAAIDRMRSEGLSIIVARTAAEAADAVHPESELLLMGDGLVADESHVLRLARAGGPTLLTLPDTVGDGRFERIDGQSRWAGLALVRGPLLKDTASMLGDWDLQSTLLRRAVQGGARHFSLSGDLVRDRLTIAETSADLVEAEATIMAQANAARGSWISRYFLWPAEEWLTRRLMTGAATPGILQIATAGLIGLGGVVALRGWLLTGLVILLLATPLGGAAERLATLRMQRRAVHGWWTHSIPALAAAAFGALAFSASKLLGWGCIALAAATVLFLYALHVEKKGQEIELDIWLAEPRSMAWLLLPFGIADRWMEGLVLLSLYAAGSFLWAQHAVHGQVPARSED